jgi:hypothetical protein
VNVKLEKWRGVPSGASVFLKSFVLEIGQKMKFGRQMRLIALTGCCSADRRPTLKLSQIKILLTIGIATMGIRLKDQAQTHGSAGALTQGHVKRVTSKPASLIGHSRPMRLSRAVGSFSAFTIKYSKQSAS